MILADQIKVVVSTTETSPKLYFAHFPVATAGNYGFSVFECESGFLNYPPLPDELMSGDLNFESIVNLTNETPGCAHFWNAFLSLTGGIVYLLDNFFDERDLRRLMTVMKYSVRNIRPTRTEVHLLTSSRNSAALKNMYLSEWNQQGNVFLRISILPTDKKRSNGGSQIGNHIHDRFALVDGKIWHFGAKVCGMHCGLNALSGPWEDVGCRMESLMKELAKQSVNIESYGGNDEGL